MPCKKFMGSDTELSTTAVDADGRPISSWKATQHVLAHIGDALAEFGGSVWTGHGSGSAYSTDCLRHWTSGGQCFYSDMGHVEVCTAETLRPTEFALQRVSLLRGAERARRLAEDDADEPLRIALSAANADILEPAISWGSHLNVAVDESLWEDLFIDHGHPARLAYVASAIAAGIVFFGTGYVLPLKDGSAVYSLSARAHHLSCVHSLSTTEAYRRGILNRRREPHGRDDRMHLIGFDYALLSARLLGSYVQTVLAAAEEGYCGMQLYDPVRALRAWSWNLDLETGKLAGEATLVDGRKLTLPAYMRELCSQLLPMCESGLISAQTAPEATDLLPRIIELANQAEAGSVRDCARHLDWAAKLLTLLGSGEPLHSPQSRLADHDFANTDPRRGALWRLWAEGLVDPLVPWDQTEQCLASPPADSRAWGRGKLIDRFRNHIWDIDWGRMEFRTGKGLWTPRLTIDMPHLDQFTQADFSATIDQAQDLAELRAMMTHRGDRAMQEADPLDSIGRELASSGEIDGPNPLSA